MALIHCPDCEREVSSRAVACPQCAYPIQNLTNLHDAAMQNEVDMMRDLLRAGQNPNEAKEDGATPLLMACQQGSLSVTKLLVTAGADINHQDQNGFTPLMEAAISGYDAIARFLLENGADRSVKNRDGETAGDLALKEEHHELAAMLNGEREKKGNKETNSLRHEEQPVAQSSVVPPIPKVVEFHKESRTIEAVSHANSEIAPIEPPPLPEESVKHPVRFVDDLAPVVEDEKYTGPGLICRTCKGQIAAEDIWCAHCKAPIIRRYCGGCHELIPDNAAQCPYCSSSKVHRFRYIRHLEQIVGGAAILGVLLFVLGVYNPQDSSSYAQKLAQQRSEQQEEKIIAAEETSKRQTQERRLRGTRPRATTTPAVVRVVPQERDVTEIVQAEQKPAPNRIPTVERIESTSRSVPEEEVKKEVAPSRSSEASSQAGEPVVEPEEARIVEQGKEEPAALRSEPERAIDREDGRTILMAERLNQQGFRLMKNGRYAEAIPVLAQAVRSFPPGQKNLTYAYALYNLGRSLRLAGRADLAIPILEERMKFANQRHIVARELEQARAEVDGPQGFDNVRYR